VPPPAGTPAHSSTTCGVAAALQAGCSRSTPAATLYTHAMCKIHSATIGEGYNDNLALLGIPPKADSCCSS
jgi:hypothetical protein